MKTFRNFMIGAFLFLLSCLLFAAMDGLWTEPIHVYFSIDGAKHVITFGREK